MSTPIFRDWLSAVAPRFPNLSALAAFVEGDDQWPYGHNKSDLRSYLRNRGHGHLAPLLAEALRAFNTLCSPSADIPEEARLPWSWHTPNLAQNTEMSSKRHSRHWNVSTQEYRWHLGRRLAKEMTAKTRIYVDTCHWVKMRDFELHRPVPPAYGEILAHLRRLVATGRYICPLSPALLLELQTQTDLNTRLHTARLMEELSHSIGLPHLDEMEKLELRRHAFDAFFRTGIQNTDWQVWTKAGFLFGERWAAPPHWIDDQTEIWGLQKQCLDSMWEAPLTQVMEVLADPLDTKDLRDHFATVMNTDRDARPATDFEFERRLALAMVIQQIVIPAAKEIAAECEAIAKNRPDFQMPTIQEKEARDPKCIPSVQILAGIEACIRTTGRKFRDNDMFDLLHCAAAIPYCQVFFCDNAFKALIIDPKLRYDVEYGIEVRSQPEEIAAFLSDLR